VGYPLALMLARRAGAGCPVLRADTQPTVTLVISAYNEAAVIGEKVRNSLELDYPADRLQVLVVSDASTDGTDNVVRSVADARVQLLRMSERGGKTLGLNEAVKRATGDILVFSDANANRRHCGCWRATSLIRGLER